MLRQHQGAVFLMKGGQGETWTLSLSRCKPIFPANYNPLQSQLTRRAGRSSQFGFVYTYSKTQNLEDNGAGSLGYSGIGCAISGLKCYRCVWLPVL